MGDLPAFAILYGPRAALSLAGIATIITGTWKAENKFDEFGVKAFENANAAGLEPVTYFNDFSDINKDELEAASPVPWMTLAGWVILGLANFVPHVVGLGWLHAEFSLPALIGFMCSVFIGMILAWPVREAYNERDFRSLVKFHQFIAGFGVILLGSLAGAQMHGPFWFGPLGAICIVAAQFCFWKNRKMGESWINSGRPNLDFVVCNGGGPLYVFGWFLFWLAFCALRGNDEWALGVPQIPIYASLRGCLAFVACILIVGLTHLTEYITDECDDLQEGLGVIGKLAGRFSELLLSVCFMVAFGLYGTASFFPAETTARKIFNGILVILLIMQGRAYGLLFQKAIPSQDANRWSRLGRIILIIYGIVLVFQAFTGWTSVIYTAAGIVMIVLGHRHIMDDRKRGKLFLDTGKPNPTPTVYSLGPVFYSAGWILLALAMSIPQFIW